MNLGLSGKVAMVGGASKGLGFAVAQALAGEGTLERFGGIDLLFTNSGGPPAGRALDFDDGACGVGRVNHRAGARTS